MIAASIEVKAQFYDLDPMQIVWHGNYARFLEQARCELLDRIGFNYVEMAKTDWAWPIVDMRTKYIRSVRFGQRIRVTARLVEWENRLRIDYHIEDAESGELLTRAQTIQMAVNRHSGEAMLESPAPLLDAVRKATA
jgi:acyl-CoA thioester hydrolase